MEMTFNGFIVPGNPGKLFVRYMAWMLAAYGPQRRGPCSAAHKCGICAGDHEKCVWHNGETAENFVRLLQEDPAEWKKYRVGTRKRVSQEDKDALAQLRRVCEDIVRLPEGQRDLSHLYKAGYTITRCVAILLKLIPGEAVALEYTPVAGVPSWRAAVGVDCDHSGLIITHLDGEFIPGEMLDNDGFMTGDESRRMQYWECFGNSLEEAVAQLVLSLTGSDLAAEGKFDLLPEEEITSI